mmetsp:Transcript_110384/g.263075  ORF Transcript_110384/g.263075 Transcript_110384/m.263075 type:complete len:308 (+) Transcript_110384:213-1136(+)
MKRGAVFESRTQRLNGAMNSAASIAPEPSASIISNICWRSTSSMSITRRRLWNSASFLAPSIKFCNVSSPVPLSSKRSKIFCKYFRSFLRLCSNSAAKFTTSFSRTSAKVSTTTATMSCSTPKTRVRREPTKMMAVAGWSCMTGIAIRPQLSPATTVLNSNRLAFMTEDAACKHSRPQSPKTFVRSCTSWMRGWTISTINMAHIVITTNPNRKLQTKVFRHVANMVTSFCSSFNERVFLKNCMRRIILARRSGRSMLMLILDVNASPALVNTHSAYPHVIMTMSSKTIQSFRMRRPRTKNNRGSSAV